MSAEAGRPTASLTAETCERLVEEAPVGIYLVQDGLVVYANRWLREFSGYEFGGGRTLEALELIHPEDRALVARQMQLRLAGGAAQTSYQARLLVRDGGVRNVALHAKLIAHRGRPAIQGTLIDVTEQVGVDRALCESVARMEESNRHRQLFGDILSHDLMNPVWIAENYLRLLSEGEIPEARRPLYDGLRRSLGRAREILADARSYLRIHNQVTAVPELVNLGSLVEATAPGLRPLWEEKAQTISFALDGDAEVWAGPLLREIVWHLLANAVKYGPPGTAVEVVVRAGPRVRLEVRDRGPGVAEEDRERIFQRFERMEKGAISGIGFGLAIARRVAQLHGGAVWVEQNPGGGSIFVAEFPRAGS